MRPRDVLNRWRARKARRGLAEGEVLCATLDPSGRPVYFSMPADAPDSEVQARAFEVRHGRKMLPIERRLLAIATARKSTEA